uniref:SWIM-type domain-containing protein n=1 Tax=Setaria italica TaxID=4555 RepID=K3YCS2_SETIT
MNESIEFFDGPPSFSDLVDRVMTKYGCRVDEIGLRGRFDCGKGRAHYVLMKLASDANWKHYKDVVHEANVACLEVIVEIVRMPGPNVVMREEVAVVNHNGTQESEMLHHVLGETERDFDLAIANDDFPNNIFERDEANIDVDNVSMGSEDCELEEDGVVGVEDISMVHKAICESSMVNAEGTSIGESPVIKKGMKFNSLEELKFFLADYAVRLHRPFSVVHSDKNLRYNVMCKQGCHWRVWSRLISSTGQLKISNVVQPHTCRSSQPKREHVQCTAKYLGRRILGIIRKDSETSVPSLVESIFIFSGYRVKYSKAWRAKQHTVALLWGDWKESYGIVPRVLSAMTYYNPGVKWCIDSCGMMLPDNGVLKHILQRVFWCFPQCSEAFQHCRPVILVDGTFLTGKYKGTLMMAVVSENNESWSWFMKLVRVHVLGPSRIVCMISDRHHGLLNCAKDHIDGFPPLVHRWCMRHFAANMSRRQKSNRVIGKLKLLCKVHTEREFCEKLEDLVKDLNDDAKELLKGEMEDKDKWAQAFDEGGMRWGIMTTNFSESLNGVFKGIRSRPVAGIIEYTFEKCNAYFVNRWEKAREMLDQGYRIGSVHHLAEPYGQERMVYSIRSYGTTNIGGESHGGRHYIVDLHEVSCTCNVPQLLHLPCLHFITACKARGLNYESPMYMSPLYSREHTIKIWESSFQPYLDPSQWPAYEGAGYVPNPSLMGNKVGRRQKKRFTGDMDVMAAPGYPLLEAAYDLHHRAHHLADLNENLTPLRARVHSPLRWDERYAQYLQRAGFLDIAVQVVGGLPPMDGPLLTAMVDRWRPETHTFHLPFGEMTITMQDAAMILGLPLEGQPVTGIIQNENWRDMVEMLIGIRSPEPEVCPPGANDEVVQRYARVWLWHFVSTFLLPDAAGNTVSWMVLPILGQVWENIAVYSWGSAALAWLYRQLCEACRRTARDSNVGGDGELWRCTTPMILYYVVEFHMPHRVMRQFGRMQPCPPLELSTSQQLHSIDRRKRYKENDWRLKHGQYLLLWQNKQGCDPEGGPYWRPNNEYIRWYCTSMRTKVKPSWTNVPIEDAPSDDDADIADVYDTVTRHGTQPECAPLHDYMLSNEAGVIMEHAVGEGDGLLRAFAERVRKSCRRMAMRMNCMTSSDAHDGGNVQDTSSGSRRTALATTPRAATSSTAAGPSRRSQGKEPASPQESEDSEGEQSEDDDPTYGEELEISHDAPPVTQTQGESSQ